MGTRSFPVVKRPGRGVDHPPPSNAEVKERVELYFYCPSGPSWPVLGWTLPLPLSIHQNTRRRTQYIALPFPCSWPASFLATCLHNRTNSHFSVRSELNPFISMTEATVPSETSAPTGETTQCGKSKWLHLNNLRCKNLKTRAGWRHFCTQRKNKFGGPTCYRINIADTAV